MTALSAAWCVTYEDPVDQTNGLPPGSLTSRTLAICGTFLALLLRVLGVARKRKQVWYIGRTRFLSILSLLVSHLGMASYALIPMSCGSLVDGKEWVYVSWRDYIHDLSLSSIYLFSIMSGLLAGYHRKQGKRVLLLFTCIFAVLQSIGMYRCPTSSSMERVGLLSLEVLAIALAQFLHYGTVNHLIVDANYSHSMPRWC
jgi:hypothetical protein